MGTGSRHGRSGLPGIPLGQGLTWKGDNGQTEKCREKSLGHFAYTFHDLVLPLSVNWLASMEAPGAISGPVPVGTIRTERKKGGGRPALEGLAVFILSENLNKEARPETNLRANALYFFTEAAF